MLPAQPQWPASIGALLSAGNVPIVKFYGSEGAIHRIHDYTTRRGAVRLHRQFPRPLAAEIGISPMKFTPRLRRGLVSVSPSQGDESPHDQTRL